MLRKLVILAFVIVVAGGIYASRGTFETVGAMVLTARDLFFPDKSSTADDASAHASAKPAVPTGLAATFSSSLMVMNGDTPMPFEASKLAKVKYLAFYYSASWCPPCQSFTPDLVSFYKEFKPSHPDFELIFVNLDHSQDDMLSYMKMDGMTWPAVWYADIDNPELDAKRFCSPAIPCLVLVKTNGTILSDSYSNGQYLDPHSVIDDIRTMVK